MARTKNSARNKNKRPKRDSESTSKKNKKKSKSRSDKKRNPLASTSKSADSDSNSSDSSTRSNKLERLLKPYSKEQLIDFLSSAVVSDPSLLSLVRYAADRDVSHRKIFVHGFGWDVTRETLVSVFQPYGEIEDCNVVTDKATGRAKGYGFVLFKIRAAAAEALKQPQKQIKGRTAFCQLASVGPASSAAGGDLAGRKIYVSNVHSGIEAEKLRAFFGRFGEIENGPMGFDPLTGKPRGYALFVYKTAEGARRALEEPHKVFEGHQLHCQLANAADPAQKLRAMVPQMPPGPAALAAAAAAQNLALFTQNPTLNPAFNALIGNSASGLMGGNSLGAGSGLGTDFGGFGSRLGGLSGSSPSLLGPYGMQGQAGQAYQSALGQSSASRAYREAGLLSGIPPYML